MRIAGLDLGERRIGVAVSDASGVIARPVKTIARGASDAAAVDAICAAIGDLGAGDPADPIGAVVVGLPLRLDGSATPQTARVETIVRLMVPRLGVPVYTQDERLSSREAEAKLALREKDWRRRKEKLDAAAAAVILQDFLDASAALEPREP